MNPFNLPLLRLTLPPPLEQRITSETLRAWQQADNLTRWVRRRAAERLLRVRQQRVVTRRATKQYLQLMRKRAQAQTTQLFEQTRTEAIRHTIQWLGTVQQIETAIAGRLAERAGHWAVDALKKLVSNLDQPALLAQQLQIPLRELQDQGALTLRVHADQLAALAQRFSAINCLAVISDKKLKPLQAVLESPVVVIQLDIEQHLTLLIEQFTNQQALVTATIESIESVPSDQVLNGQSFSGDA